MKRGLVQVKKECLVNDNYSSYPDEIKSILYSMLESDDSRIRQGAAIGLANPEAENMNRIVAVLMEGLQYPGLSIQSAQALGKIGKPAASAKPQLEKASGYIFELVAKDALEKITGK